MDARTVLAARAAEILGARWEHDPLRRWEPNERQSMFLECNKSEAALLGANRSGKSDGLAALVASLARFGHPDPRASYAAGGRIELYDRAMSIWVVGLTERLMKEGIQPKIITTAYTASETHPAFIPQSEIDGCNINEQTWRLKNGSILGFKSADAGRDVFQSASRDLVAFDEICDWEVYKESTFRVPGGGRRLLIRLAATLLPPLGMAGGVSWYFPKKIKPWWAAGNKENTSHGANPAEFMDIFTMGMRHNRHISPDEIRRIEETFPPGSFEHRIRVEGELLATIGGTPAYPAFNRAYHVDSKLLPESLDPRVPLCLTCDFNVTPCMWIVGQRIDNTWCWFDEIRMDECNIPMMVEEFRRRYPTHSAKLLIYGDQTGTARNVQTSVSNYYLISEGLKGYPVPFEICLPKRNPLVVDRLHAMNRQLTGPDGRIGMIFGPLCEETIADMEEVQRDAKGGIKKVSNSEDPYFMRTHASDAIGYAVTYTDPVPHNVSLARTIRSMPMPGFLGRGGRAGQSHMPPAGYSESRFGRFPGGGVRAPRR